MPCPVCNQNTLEVFFQVENAPVLPNVLYETRAAAIAAPRAPIHLAHCKTCSHIYNIAFDPECLDYTQTYENSLYFSQHFRDYADSQARSLVARHNLRNKTIVEIGCGQGDFLTALCILGDNQGRGFDPAYDPAKSQTTHDRRVQITAEYFTEQHTHCNPDLIVCRQVLEHIPSPIPFLKSIRQTVNNHLNTAIYFEVPDGLYTLRDLGIWDIIYEHCSYFTPKSLATAFKKAKYTPQSVEETFGKQFLIIDAIPAGISDVSADSLDYVPAVDTATLVAEFNSAYQSRVDYWRKILADLISQSKRAVIWGAGSKGITFLNVLADHTQCIQYAVDINPRKHGKFITGTGQQIVPPQFLAEYKPDLVIAMNPQYHDEIQVDLNTIAPHAKFLPV